jgi:hypothetical protein
MIRRYLIIPLLIITLTSCNLIPGNISLTPTATSLVQTPTIPTATATQLVETATPSPTAKPTVSSTPIPTNTPIPTPSLTAYYDYGIQVGSPAVVANFLHPDAGCNYTGIGGQVFSKNGKPISDQIVVKVTGNLEEKTVEFLAVTGGFPALGPGGYEITLADHLTATTKSLFLQLFDLKGIAVSPLISFNTYSDCAMNLVILNFVEASTVSRYYFPIIINK